MDPLGGLGLWAVQALPLIGMESAAAWMQSCVVTLSMWSCVIVVVCL